MRVLHAPVNVANQPWTLSRAERELGVDSRLVTNYRTSFGFPDDLCLGTYARPDLRGITRRLAWGLSAPFRFDVLHYYFGRSLLCWDDWGRPNALWFADLRLARRLGRRVFMTLQGCDVRLAAESNRSNRWTPCAEGRCSSFRSCVDSIDAARRRLIEDVLPDCHRVLFLNPELGRFAKGASFLPYASVDVDSVVPAPPRKDGPPLLVHAPTDRGIKGTAHVLAAVETIQRRYDVRFELIQGVPHSEALRRYREADIVIDQLLAGWYGGLAVEVMAMGKPVVCYLRREDFGCLPEPMVADLPLLEATTDDLADRLAEILDSRSQWPHWSERSMAYVRRWHHPKRLARLLIEAYRASDSHFELAALARS